MTRDQEHTIDLDKVLWERIQKSIGVAHEFMPEEAKAHYSLDYWVADICDWLETRHLQAAKREPVCSCPSGDGSLRWPCQAHPPSVSDEMLDAACEAYADMYDVDYGVDNRRQCIESALIAALTTPRGG